MPELTLVLGQNQHLIATFTPATPTVPPAGWVAVLSNSGVIPRTGPHRLNVRMARRFAEMGIPSVRFDLSGLGDSRRADTQSSVVAQWVSDTRCIMDAAQKRWGHTRFFMIGFCSGAEVAHLTALEDERMKAAVLWDFYAFPTPLAKLHKQLYRMRRAGLKGTLDKLFKRLTGQALPPPNVRDDGLQGMNDGPKTPPDVYMNRFDQLADKGVELFFYYSGGEPEWFAYRGQFRDMFQGRRFYDKVAFDQLAISDHLITTQASQQAFMAAVDGWLRGRVLGS